MKGLVPFDQAGFEAGILLAMCLGIPDDPELQPTFVTGNPASVATSAPYFCDLLHHRLQIRSVVSTMEGLA